MEQRITTGKRYENIYAVNSASSLVLSCHITIKQCERNYWLYKTKRRCMVFLATQRNFDIHDYFLAYLHIKTPCERHFSDLNGQKTFIFCRII